MPRRKLLVFLCVPALLVAFAAAAHAINRAAGASIGFYVWKYISGKAKGGGYVSVDNVRIYYETYGSGQPVLILHGGLGRLEAMKHQIRALAETRFVIAADSRGHGRSSDAAEPLSYSRMADDMIGLLDALHIKTADIVGWSDGGIIGLELAMRFPQRVRRLVVIGSNYDVDGLVDVPDPAAEPPRRGGWWRRDEPDSEHWAALYRKVVTMWLTEPHYNTTDLAKIKAPTLVMAGEFDAIRREHTDQLAKSIVGAREEIIAEGSHSIIRDQADVVNDYLLRFLDESYP
jgi:pimeloyl-ACP methyl ester carboxylesterase